MNSVTSRKRPRPQTSVVFRKHLVGKRVFQTVTLSNPSKRMNAKLEVIQLPPSFLLHQTDWDVEANGSIDIEIGWKPSVESICNQKLILEWKIGTKTKKEIVQLMGESIEPTNKKVKVFEDEEVDARPLKRRRLESEVCTTDLQAMPLKSIDANVIKKNIPKEKTLNDFIHEVAEEKKKLIARKSFSNTVQGSSKEDWKHKVQREQRDRWMREVILDVENIREEISRLERVYNVTISDLEGIQASFNNPSITTLFHWYATVMLIFEEKVTQFPTKSQSSLVHEILFNFYEYKKIYKLKQEIQKVLHQDYSHRRHSITDEKYSVTTLATLCQNLLAGHRQKLYTESILTIQKCLQANISMSRFKEQKKLILLVQNGVKTAQSMISKFSAMNSILFCQSQLFRLHQQKLKREAIFVRLQSIIRGNQTRARILYWKQCTTKIQVQWRLKQSIRQFHHEKHCICTVQRILRHNIVSIFIQTQKALPLQNVMRTIHSQAHFRHQLQLIICIQSSLRTQIIQRSFEASEALEEYRLHQRFIRDLRLIRRKAKQFFEKELEAVSNFEKSIQMEKNRQEAILQSRIRTFEKKQEGKDRKSILYRNETPAPRVYGHNEAHVSGIGDMTNEPWKRRRIAQNVMEGALQVDNMCS